MKKAVAILYILSAVLLSQLSAAEGHIVAKDDFSTSGGCPNEFICKGWSNGTSTAIDTARTAGSYSLRIQRSRNATKTFFFPTLKAGQNVTVTFRFGKSSTSAAYTLTTKLNNETYTYNFISLNGAVADSTSTSSAQYFKDITYTAKLNVDKKLQIDFVVSGASGSDYGYVNSITIEANGVVWIDDAQMEQNFDADKYMNFTVHNPSALPAEIEYETRPINAQEGVDYEYANGTLEFVSGETSKTISVKILRHIDALEADKRFAVDIESNDVYIMDTEAIGVIKAYKGAVSIEDAGFIYAGSSSINSTAVFTLRNSYDVPVSVNYQTEDISAVEGVNYVAKNGTITFAAGEKTKEINITVIGSDTLTTQKEFKVTLTSGAHLTRKSAVAVLYGDDNSQNSSGTNTCTTSDIISFLNNSTVPVSGVIKGSMNTTRAETCGTSCSDKSSNAKGRYYKFTAGMDARVEITIRGLNRTLDFIQAVRVNCSQSDFFRFSPTSSTYNMYYVLKANEHFEFSTGVTLPANSPLAWWMNPEGEIKHNDMDKRRVEHSVMHLKRGETGYFFVGAYNSANTQVTTDYEIEIKYLPEATDITGLPDNGISSYDIVNPLSTRNLYGNIKLIGNSFLCMTSDYGSGHSSSFKNLIDDGYLTKPSGDICTKDYTQDANHQQMPYLDMDGDPSTYNSVMARLSTPAGSKVVWAGLFWTGMVDRNSPQYFRRHQAAYRSYSDKNTYEDNSFDVEKILLKTPGSSSYQEVYAQKLIYVNGDGAAMFGAYKDITDIINAEAADGEYWAANFRGSAGQNDIGNYGGWSMVVIYEEDIDNPNIEGVFRNLSVFNGFGRVASGKDIYLSGFLTPKNGNVDAFLHIFAGEGELSHEGDYITLIPSKMGTSGNNIKVKDISKYPANFIATHPSTLTGAEKMSLIGRQLSHSGTSNYNNIMTGTIGKADRYPITLNGNGLDLKSIDIGEHMKNLQTNFTIGLHAGADYFYPSMVATSVQLYDPNICYEENVTYNGLPIQAGNLPPKNAIVEYLLTLKHKEHENAEKVTIRKSFIEEYGLEYVSESMQVRNNFDAAPAFNAKTDAIGDDTAQYDNATIRVNVGRGASASQGGMMQTNESVSDIVELKYKAKLITNETIPENVYIIDYSNKELNLDFTNRPIKKCYDFSITVEIGQPPEGVYRVVYEKFSKTSGDTISDDPLHDDNALYTQIASKEFNVKLVSVDNQGGLGSIVSDPTLGGAYNKTVRLELIEYPHYIAGMSNAEKQEKCENAAAIQTYPDYNVTGSVTDIDNIAVDNAHRNVTFRVVDTKDTPLDASDDAMSCSFDMFAVRPAQFNIEVLTLKLIGGKENNDTNLTAVKADYSTRADLYNQGGGAISLGSTALDVPTGCDWAALDHVSVSNFHISNEDFINGTARISTKFDNVGDVKVGFVDSEWTGKDVYGGKTDCNSGNASNVHDAYGRVGCDTTTNGSIVTFIPNDFFANITVNGTGGGDFVYLSNNASMVGNITTQLSARLANNDTATNYHMNCFAKDVTYKIRLNNNNIIDWNNAANRTTSRGNTAKQRVLFYEIEKAALDNNNTGKDGTGNFTVGESNFTNGEVLSGVKFGFNFERVVDKAENPFIVNAKADFFIDNGDIKDDDVNSTTAEIADTNITFFYGRSFIDDQEGRTAITAAVDYELFCENCNISKYSLSYSDLSKEGSSKWFVNRKHNNIDSGNIPMTNYIPQGNSTINGAASPANGAGSVTIQSQYHPNHRQDQDTIHATPNDWLIYNRHNPAAKDINFIVKFIGDPGGWAGKGNTTANTTGVVIDALPGNKTKMKADW
jgi:hypothetical protein